MTDAQLNNLIGSGGLFGLAVIAILIFAVITLRKSIYVVPQSYRFTVERFGRYTRTLDPGLSFIVPWLDRIGSRVSVLERQLEDFHISVITRDNVEIELTSTVFFRVLEPAETIYRIKDINRAIYTTATSIVRSAAGRLDLDELQTSRDAMNDEIARNLTAAADEWGVEITRTEITDVTVDEQTKEAQRRQLNAERERRAVVAEAEGKRQAVELAAQADLYRAEKEAEAIRVTADAEAYAVERKAAADAEQTKLLANAIAINQGQEAIDFEVRKRQVGAISDLASADTTRTLILPAEVTGVLGSIETLREMLSQRRGNDAPGAQS